MFSRPHIYRRRHIALVMSSFVVQIHRYTYIHTLCTPYVGLPTLSSNHRSYNSYSLFQNNAYIPTCILIQFLLVSINTCLPTYLPAYMHTYKHKYIHAYIHTYIHAYIHTYMHAFLYLVHSRFQNDMEELITKNGIDEQTTIGNWLRIWDAIQVFAILVPYHVK